ncbi:MAG: efflux RND transporter permease subunit [Phycisphaerae bacterium]|nr:efflux RND transporter permease subunit [Phycisphaerae bacterium]
MIGAPREKGLLAWMARNHVAANLLMLVLVGGGLIVAMYTKQEVFPEYALDIIDVGVSYPGASPEEVEEGITLAIEDEVRSLEGVKEISSSAYEGYGKTTIELAENADPNKMLQEVKAAVDRIRSFPEDVERPRISLQRRRRDVMRLVLYGAADERDLFYKAQSIRNELLDLPSITDVDLGGVRSPEITVEIPEPELRKYAITLGDVARAIRNSALDLPAGGIKARGGEVLLRTAERRDFASEFDDIAVISRRDGTEVKLADIAVVRDDFADSHREAYFNGRRGVTITVFRTGDETPIGISKDVRRYVEKASASLPDGVKLEVFRDWSDVYRDRRDLLLKNGTMGLVLVLVLLGLFLDARMAFWVAMGIPISVMGSFLLFPLVGGTINIISMFGFIITLGIVVDDAMVIGENIYYERQRGVGFLKASITGVRDMAAPVSIAVITNVIAFLPLLFVPGSIGRFFMILPAVVIAVFIISLVECLIILPAHLAWGPTGPDRGLLGAFERFQRRIAAGLEWFIHRAFEPVLRQAVRHRYVTVSAALATLIVMWSYWDTGRIEFSFRPSIQATRLDAEITLPYGAPIEDVRDVADKIERAGIRAVERADGKSMVKAMMKSIGRRGGNTAEINFYLVDNDQRNTTAREFSTIWREEVGDIPGLEKLFFDYLIGPGGSSAIKIELTHTDPEILKRAAEDLAKVLPNYTGVTDVYKGFAQGKRQFDFTLKPHGRSLGLDPRELGRQIRHAFYGAEALRQQRGRNEVRVMVRLPESERRSLYNLEELLLRTPDGGDIPLGEAAQKASGRAYTEIRRVNGKRVRNVSASVIPGVVNENKVLDDLKVTYMPQLESSYPGLKWSFVGHERSRRESMGALGYGLCYAMVGIYILLAALFRSYVMPALVMISIPLGITGSLLGHIIMGYDLSIISIFGIIALCGVVVNGGLVLVVTANRYLENGDDVGSAAVRAGARRFRPIVLAALTTFFGLAPMIFETSISAKFLIPMAISLGFGILFATPVILILTPALYVIKSDLGEVFRFIFGHPPRDPE